MYTNSLNFINNKIASAAGPCFLSFVTLTDIFIYIYVYIYIRILGFDSLNQFENYHLVEFVLLENNIVKAFAFMVSNKL